MRLLNLCCGSVRPQSTEVVEWSNLDNLYPVLPETSVERWQLLSESNYYECDILSGPIPMQDGYFDGIVASHCFEHWDCINGIRIMKDCWRLLKPLGILIVSVPDASYFREVNQEDSVENAERLFGETIYLPDGEITFLGYALFNRHHRAVLSEDSLWCYFIRSGFIPNLGILGDDTSGQMRSILNRQKFSLVMTGIKP